MTDAVIAVDPGRDKCGVAVVGRRAGVMDKSVVPADRMTAVVAELAARHGIATVILGDRTGSKAAMAALTALRPGGRELTVRLVDEHRSTDEARARYWRDNPPRGLARLVPVTLRVPPVPVDDYVAVIIAERYFRK
ncbi:pre-16S rRNA-processing nuclease YqgF [Anaeroselena agilis]|uniref:Pre-16S rRNA-processing nuclease YqgF n=1 Tax=Anaeroselena agilis TaxID=3063788 RepID=A0ABU3P541_9FIRM|nr:pre-16S rRNA-processing nuclease YqgF [Selenomonadales bacterium 4137-cl]